MFFYKWGIEILLIITLRYLGFSRMYIILVLGFIVRLLIWKKIECIWIIWYGVFYFNIDVLVLILFSIIKYIIILKFYNIFIFIVKYNIR